MRVILISKSSEISHDIRCDVGPMQCQFTPSSYGVNSRQIELNNASLRILDEVESLHELTYLHRQEERLSAAALVPPASHAVCGTFRVHQEPFAKLRGTLDLGCLSLEDAA